MHGWRGRAAARRLRRHRNASAHRQSCRACLIVVTAESPARRLPSACSPWHPGMGHVVASKRGVGSVCNLCGRVYGVVLLQKEEHGIVKVCNKNNNVRIIVECGTIMSGRGIVWSQSQLSQRHACFMSGVRQNARRI